LLTRNKKVDTKCNVHLHFSFAFRINTGKLEGRFYVDILFTWVNILYNCIFETHRENGGALWSLLFEILIMEVVSYFITFFFNCTRWKLRIITDILFKVALNTINQTKKSFDQKQLSKVKPAFTEVSGKVITALTSQVHILLKSQRLLE